MLTFDSRTVDSTGAYLVGELERLDQTLHAPLAAVSWPRDIDLREDVSLADDVSSFTLSTFGSAGSLGTGNGIGNGKAWIGKSTDQVGGVSVDISKITNPLTPWGLELKYTILELESSVKLGRPIDVQKYDAMTLKYQMDVDEQVYIGDVPAGFTGLVNSARVTASNVPNGAGGFPQWNKKTPQEIIADVNALLAAAWAASGYAVMPQRLLLPPTQFGYLSATPMSIVGSGNGGTSVLRYIQENSLLTTSGNGKLEIAPLKWLVGAGAGGTLGTTGTVDRMVAYTKRKDLVRFPMTLLQRTAIQYESIYQKTTYFGKLGVVEVVYPETMVYLDGI